MNLYTFVMSPNARKARMAALLLGTSMELVTVDLAKGEQRKPEFLKINPNGRVPVLEDEGLVLWESNAIMAYLADKKPGNTLYPSELRARADVNRWMFWAASHWSPAFGALNFENSLKRLFNLGDPDPAQVKRQEDFLRTFAAVLDGHLAGGRQWLCGPALTLADIAVGVPLMMTARAKAPVQSYANLQAWFGRVQALDAWKQTEPPPLPAGRP
ncbi:MAG TPA: glutathione S-transferase family protein [bacterium]|nr:glutathione S-transferase family protein [bacterium]